MRKTFFAAAAVLGLGLISSANAAPVPAAAAAVPVLGTAQATQAAVIVRRRVFRRPLCTVTVTRYRTRHGWETRRVRRCR